jgi:serine/threonine protein kinase
MELANCDWNNEIKKRQKKNLKYSEKEIINIIKQLTDACLYLENEGIAHRDIKPQNILLFNKNIFKLADFGEAKSINDTSQECTLRGSELYMSPILYNGLKINQKDVVHNAYKSDVFSFGFCILYALTLNLRILNDIRNIINMNVINNNHSLFKIEKCHIFLF